MTRRTVLGMDDDRRRAEMEAVIAKHQAILDAMPPQEGTPGDYGWLVTEIDDWAPYRRAANELLLDGDEA